MTGEKNLMSYEGRAETTKNEMPVLFWWIAKL